jgi:ABC-type Fe3+-hydroxamate transport system substrate-binding protein
MRRTMNFLASGLAACALVLALGCASSGSHTETTVTRTYGPLGNEYVTRETTVTHYPESVYVPPEEVTSTNTTTTTTTTSNEPHSVLGDVVYAVGDVVTLPFRVVGLLL